MRNSMCRGFCQTCAGVVEVLNLPFARRDIPPAVARDGRLTVTTVGVVNPKEGVDAVIDAIGQSAALREKVRYVVAGAADDACARRSKAKPGGLGVDFQLLGRIEDDRLMQVLDEADIMCCLRRPVLEGASGSAIEAMLSGRATIIADAGFYGELPDRYVAKVPADFSPSDLARAIEGLAADAESRLRMGVEARSWALEMFSGDAYAVMLESVVRDQARLEPYLELSDRVAKRLARLGFGGSSKIIGVLRPPLTACGNRTRSHLTGSERDRRDDGKRKTSGKTQAGGAWRRRPCQGGDRDDPRRRPL